jgi:hypothetical protein
MVINTSFFAIFEKLGAVLWPKMVAITRTGTALGFNSFFRWVTLAMRRKTTRKILIQQDLTSRRGVTLIEPIFMYAYTIDRNT